MRIGIDATSWANDRGYGRYTREIVAAMVAQAPAHEFVCVLDERAASRFSLDAANVTRNVVPQSLAPTLAAATGGRRALADMMRLTRAVRRRRVQAFYSPSVYGYFPLPIGLPAAVTVHDAIAERHPELTLPSWRDRLAWRAKVWLALRQARVILTVSDYAAAQIAAAHGVPRSRLRVTLEAAASAFKPSASQADIDAAAARAGVPPGSRWFIYVGGFGPHKHVDLIAQAHAAVARRLQTPIVLLLVGAEHDGFFSDGAAVRRVIQQEGTTDLVRWTGFLADEDVRQLHSGAIAALLPSEEEGFGLPAIEAARCGAPVIATTESPLPALLAGGGLFVAPGNVVALEDAMFTLACEDSRARSSRRAEALRRASALSWDHSARVVLSALEEIAR